MSVRTTGEAPAPGRSTGAGPPAVSGDDAGYGWVAFAGVLLVIAGMLNAIYGIAAIDDAQFFVGNTEFVFSNLNTWGWIVLCLGVAQLLIAFGVFAKNQFARWTGVFVLGMNSIAQMLFIDAYPFLSLSILAMNLLAIYGLAAYGGRIATTR
ncbi:MAG TPA: hypothetical protein VFY44_12030 [Thermoleophilaceae bacterium]|nr:hypothetical protein [Thermoleophilaceae bacterium]